MLFTAPFVTLEANRLGRDFVIGDLHGQARLLDRALKLVNFSRETDRVFALGDLVDRGPDSLKLLKRLAAEPWFCSVRGNHEAMLRESRTDEWVRYIWDRNGNEWSRALKAEAMNELASIVQRMPLAIELALPDGRHIGLVHAEVELDRGWNELPALLERAAADEDADDANDVESMLWGRRRVMSWARVMAAPEADEVDAGIRAATWNSLLPVQGIDRVIAGHTILTERQPVAVANLLFIDTGAYEDGGRLTIVDLAADEYWQVARTGMRARAVRTVATPLPAPMPVPDAWRPDPREAV